MKVRAVLFIGLILGCELSARAENSFWEMVEGKDYSASHLGLTEIEKGKDVNRKLLFEKTDHFPLHIRTQQDRVDLAAGKVLLTYKLLTGSEFQKEFARLPTLSENPVFQGALVSAVSGIFVTDVRPEDFHYPQNVLSKERMEQAVRKMTFLSKVTDYKVKADKMVKAVGMKFHIPFVFEASWFLQAGQKWMGSENHHLAQSEMEFLTEQTSINVLQTHEPLTHMVEIFGDAEDRYVRGVSTLFISFVSPDKKHAVVCFWQFVAANDLKLVKFLSYIPFVGGAIEDKLKKTALRDFARNVDVIRAK